MTQSRSEAQRRRSSGPATTVLLTLAFLGAYWAGDALAQAPEEGTRQLWNTEFLDKRPASASAAKNRANLKYKPAPGKAAPRPASPDSASLMVGVTLWRMRPAGTAKGGSRGARLLVLEPGVAEGQETEPERLETDTLLSEGDQVRLSVEVPAFGYLYVLDRETYADGTLSEPYLIYPNWQTPLGDNVVGPGRLLEIPQQTARPNCFTIRSSRRGNTGELLVLLITPKPVEGLNIGRNPLKLDLALLAEWEKQSDAATESLELDGGAGQGWTEREKQAGGSRDLILTQDDAPPQTLYRIFARAGSPMMLKIPLRMK